MEAILPWLTPAVTGPVSREKNMTMRTKLKAASAGAAAGVRSQPSADAEGLYVSSV